MILVKNKLLKGALALSLLTNTGTASYLFMQVKEKEANILDLQGDVKTKSSEIANLSDVIAKKDDNLNAKKKVIVKQKLQIEKKQQEKKQLQEILKEEKELRIKAERKASLINAEKETILRAEAKAEAESKARQKSLQKNVTAKKATNDYVAPNTVTKQIKEYNAKQSAKEETAHQAKKKVVHQSKKQSVETSNGRNVGSFEMTAYVATCNGCSGITASGYDVRSTVTYNGMRIIATDTSVIPLHSIVKVTTPNGSFTAIALDTGGAINGHIIDYLVSSESEALSLGRQKVTIEIIGKG